MILTTTLVILYLKCFGAMLLSLVLHTLKEYSDMQDLYRKGNVGELDFKKFLLLKPVTHFINLVSCLLWLFLVPDIARQFPTVNGSVYLANILHIVGCMVVGFFNSLIIIWALGVGKNYAMSVIDKKTNIADGKDQSPVTGNQSPATGNQTHP